MSHYFLFFLIVVSLWACYRILTPYLNAIILAFILAAIFNPLHERILSLVRHRSNVAALLSCLVLTIVVVLPFFLLFLALIQQGVYSLTAVSQWIEGDKYRGLLDHAAVKYMLSFVNTYLPDIQKIFPEVDPQKLKFQEIVLQVSSSVGKFLVQQGSGIFGNLAAVIGNFCLMLFTFFFAVRDEEKILKTILHLMPLNTSQENQLISKIRAISKSALLGTLVTAAAQGAAGGIAFRICGFPGLFWGVVMAFCALIPLVGTALVWVPAGLYLLATGQWGYAIFLLIWCGGLVGLIDNIVRPLFMQGSAEMSPLLIFFAILGGIHVFGLLGILYGPLIFGLALVLLYIYRMEFESFLDHQDRT